MYKPHTVCRACGYGKDPNAPGTKSQPATQHLIPVLDLGLQPLANDFRKAGEERQGFAPLQVLYCPRCTLAQLSVVVDPSILYRHYAYVTSPSEMMRKHFETLIADIRAEQAFGHVLEIGSNDGRLLKTFQEEGASYILGVDPAENLAALAEQSGVPTLCALFNKTTAERILTTCAEPDVIVARHVFCHVDDWRSFIRGLELLARPNTLICIEAPYAGNTLKNGEFDQIYHEHLSFLTLKAFDALLAGTSLKLRKVIHYPIHGGSVLLMLRHRCHASDSAADAVAEHIGRDQWQALADTAKDQINRLGHTVRAARAQGKRVFGVGASAKSTVWLNACGFTRKDVECVTDNTPQKQLTFSPGTDIPVVDEGAILRELPNYAILFAWNYRDEVLQKFQRARELGVKFIIPVPTITLV